MAMSDQVVVLDAGQRLAAGTPATCRPTRGAAGLPGRGAGLKRGQVRARLDPAAPELLGVGRSSPATAPARAARHRPAGARRRTRRAAGRQRRRQVDPDARAGRPASPGQGGIHLAGHELAGAAAERIARLGLVLVPEGRQVFPELSVPTTCAWARSCSPQAATRMSRTCCALPAPARAAAATRRPAVRRRAADAGDRPRPDGQAARAAARRTVAGPGAEGHRRTVRGARHVARRSA
jgi:hypothetical protein